MYNNDFGKYIRFLRIDRNLSLSQLAERLSITPYYHPKANRCVSYDVADFIMSNRNILEAIRAARDKPEAAPNWNDFMEKINKKI